MPETNSFQRINKNFNKGLEKYPHMAEKEGNMPSTTDI